MQGRGEEKEGLLRARWSQMTRERATTDRLSPLTLSWPPLTGMLASSTINERRSNNWERTSRSLNSTRPPGIQPGAAAAPSPARGRHLAAIPGGEGGGDMSSAVHRTGVFFGAPRASCGTTPTPPVVSRGYRSLSWPPWEFRGDAAFDAAAAGAYEVWRDGGKSTTKRVLRLNVGNLSAFHWATTSHKSSGEMGPRQAGHCQAPANKSRGPQLSCSVLSESRTNGDEATRQGDKCPAVPACLVSTQLQTGIDKARSEKDSVTGGCSGRQTGCSGERLHTAPLRQQAQCIPPYVDEVVQTLRRDDTNAAMQERVQYCVVIFAGYVSLFPRETKLPALLPNLNQTEKMMGPKKAADN